MGSIEQGLIFPTQLPPERIGAIGSRDSGSQQGLPDIFEWDLDGRAAANNRLEVIFFQSMVQRRGITKDPVGLVSPSLFTKSLQPARRRLARDRQIDDFHSKPGTNPLIQPLFQESRVKGAVVHAVAHGVG